MADVTREGVLKNMQEAADRMGLDLEDLQEMIVEVLEDCSAKSKSMQDAVSAGDTEKIKALAHDIKGSTANYGLMEASDLALKIEKNCSDMPKEPIAELVEQFDILSKFNLEQAD
ncbi:MAG: Hpt domain-containing protein [Proteobacteria bacterium]|nr:Hpt domain-containing protein [Pseudomonadota bacterium]